MQSFETWLTTGGPHLADLLDAQREPICQTVTIRLEEVYPALCYNHLRPDAKTFQRTAFTRSPERLHIALQAALRFGTLGVIDREYRWFWTLGPRHGVGQEHFLNMHRWYFKAARDFAPLTAADREALDAFEETLLQIAQHISSLTTPAAPVRRIERRSLA